VTWAERLFADPLVAFVSNPTSNVWIQSDSTFCGEP
jgi:hypothetical protein